MAVSALVFGAVGLCFLAGPAAMTALVGIELRGPTAAGDVRAVYGGLQIAIAGFLAHCAWAERLHTGLWCAGLLLLGLAGGRALGVALDGWPDRLGLGLWASELLGVGFAAAALSRLRQRAAP